MGFSLPNPGTLPCDHGDSAWMPNSAAVRWWAAAISKRSSSENVCSNQVLVADNLSSLSTRSCNAFSVFFVSILSANKPQHMMIATSPQFSISLYSKVENPVHLIQAGISVRPTEILMTSCRLFRLSFSTREQNDKQTSSLDHDDTPGWDALVPRKTSPISHDFFCLSNHDSSLGKQSWSAADA